MATSVYPAQGGAVGLTETKDGSSNAVFVPELYSDELIVAYKNNLILANFVKRISFQGKKGDTIYFPKPQRGFAAQAKAENTAVTIQNLSNDRFSLSLNTHVESSFLIEDRVDVQAFEAIKDTYRDDAAYSLAKKVDDDLFLLGRNLGDGNGSSWVHSRSFMFDSNGNLTAYDGNGTTNANDFADAGWRRAIQYLDDANVPQEGRVLVLPPSQRRVLMGIPRYTEEAFVGERGGDNTIRNGEVGSLYGVPVVITTNCPTVDTTGTAGLFIHKDAFMLGEQLSMRTQTQYKQEFLGTLVTSDMLYGVGCHREDNGVALIF